MTAPSQEAVSAIPDAEVRELVERLRARTIYTQMPGRPFLSKFEPEPLCALAAEMIERLASRPTREEIRDEALEERIREDVVNKLYAGAEEEYGFWLYDASIAILGITPELPEDRAALRSRTPAPSGKQDVDNG